MLIAVTGATGFIGKALCKRLLEDGHQVRALIRHPRKIGGLSSEVEPVQGDITQAASLPALLAGVDAIVHCAGSVRGATQADFDAVNVAGLDNLLDAIRATGSKAKLLSLSSLAAREPDISCYANSKYRGEQRLRQETSISWTIFRPPAVYGPGDKELLPLFQLMQRGIALIPGSLQTRFSMLYIDDLVEAICAWLHSQAPVNAVYTLEDGFQGGYSWPDVLSTFSALSGRRLRPILPPAWLLDLLAYLNRFTARLLGYAPMLTPGKLRELRHPDWVTDSHALKSALNWSPQVTLREGLRRTVFESTE